ncbi:hypothetical protein Nepgr_018939 [Nepenthes gracilis]|uniref:BHLH domain-containing protein n=1 Tax=Nepenthes gracilis TaxID=150966 RepID=A0AAD3XTX4_NEPGR|nr:hypothetical protein Nepgr_018939 [Nepenthes gracilis]
MELPQSGSYGAEGRKPTHGFFSLYSRSPVQQDPRPSYGGSLKTRNFLQPLEKEEKNRSKEEEEEEENMLEVNVERPPQVSIPCPSAEHILPGRVGTYSINHISYINPRALKPERKVFRAVASAGSSERIDENPIHSSYTRSGFMLWDESAARKGKAENENLEAVTAVMKEQPVEAGQWPLDRPSESSSNHRNSLSSLSSSQPSLQKNQSFVEMINYSKGPHAKEEDDDEDFSVKIGSCAPKGKLRVKVDGKSSNEKANTPRSKHSATEQRRRCKINDRFQLLRELIPHSEQKRDKASFLLEVIEYIQFLQEKLYRYEGSHPRWNQEPAKMTPWSNCHRPTERSTGHSRGVNEVADPVVMFGAKLEEENNVISSNIPKNPLNSVESDMKNAIACKVVEQGSGIADKAVPTGQPLQADIFAPVRNNNAVLQSSARLASDAGNTSLLPFPLQQRKPCASGSSTQGEKLKEQEMAAEDGTISISSTYSQGLLDNLTRALESSGVDLSHASIAIEVDFGKRAESRHNTHRHIDKNDEVNYCSRATLRSRGESYREESDQATKKPKTSRS